MKVLVFAAHPDDEVLGCGATINKYVEQGHTVSVCIATTNGSARQQVLEAKDLLKYQRLEWWRLRDQSLDRENFLSLIDRVIAELLIVEPDLILTHHLGDLNRDHVILSEAVLVASQPHRSKATLRTYFVPSATEQISLGPQFVPNVWSVCNQLHVVAKMGAMTAYAEEMRTDNHPRSVSNLSVSMRSFGAQICAEYAEPFCQLRSVE